MQEQIAIGEYEIKIINNEQIKTQPSSIVYVNIVKELKSRDIEFYTYKSKQKRSFKVVPSFAPQLQSMRTTQRTCSS